MRRQIRPEAFLARLPPFQGLSPEDLGRLAAATTRRELRRGDVVFREGDMPTGFYVVVHGRVALTTQAAGGRERVSEIVGAGRSFGEAIMFLDKPYIVSARALGDGLVLHIAKDILFRELELYALGSGAQRFAAWLLRALPGKEQGAAALLATVKVSTGRRNGVRATHS